MAQQNLAGSGLVAEGFGQGHHRPDSSVIHPTLEADGPECGVAHRHSGREIELVANSTPGSGQRPHLFTHIEREARALLRGVRTRERIVEENLDLVAGEAVHRAAESEYQSSQSSVVLTEDAHHFFRLGLLGKDSKPAQGSSHNRDFPPMALQYIISG